jgi:hypothetical protein
MQAAQAESTVLHLSGQKAPSDDQMKLESPDALYLIESTLQVKQKGKIRFDLANSA